MAMWYDAYNNQTASTYTAATAMYDDQITNAGTSMGQMLFWPTWHNAINTITIASLTNTGTGTTSIYWPVWHDNVVAPAIIRSESDWEQRNREAVAQQQAEYRSRELAESQRRREANNKAKEILLQHLTQEQRDMMDKLGWFVVQGGKSGKLYRVNSKAIAGNVEELVSEKAIARYCCHLDHKFPTHDHHLAQKFMLEHDEEEFLRLANKTALAA